MLNHRVIIALSDSIKPTMKASPLEIQPFVIQTVLALVMCHCDIISQKRLAMDQHAKAVDNAPEDDLLCPMSHTRVEHPMFLKSYTLQVCEETGDDLRSHVTEGIIRTGSTPGRSRGRTHITGSNPEWLDVDHLDTSNLQELFHMKLPLPATLYDLGVIGRTILVPNLTLCCIFQFMPTPQDGVTRPVSFAQPNLARRDPRVDSCRTPSEAVSTESRITGVLLGRPCINANIPIFITCFCVMEHNKGIPYEYAAIADFLYMTRCSQKENVKGTPHVYIAMDISVIKHSVSHIYIEISVYDTILVTLRWPILCCFDINLTIMLFREDNCIPYYTPDYLHVVYNTNFSHVVMLKLLLLVNIYLPQIAFVRDELESNALFCSPYESFFLFSFAYTVGRCTGPDGTRMRQPNLIPTCLGHTPSPTIEEIWRPSSFVHLQVGKSCPRPGGSCVALLSYVIINAVALGTFSTFIKTVMGYLYAKLNKLPDTYANVNINAATPDTAEIFSNSILGNPCKQCITNNMTCAAVPRHVGVVV